MSLLKDIDLGTPAVIATAEVQVEIDGQPVQVPAGTSIIRAAALAGISVPKLCATDRLNAFGSCRLLRHFYTTSSCGVCGKASLDALHQQRQIAAPDANFVISADALRQLPARLARGQATFAQTGGLHCAGLFDSAGELSGSFEDVGRHNALDKLVGASVMSGNMPWSSYGVMLSGRASFELLQKAMMAGAPLVAAIGAPSSLAIELAEEFDITLVGFLRDDGFNVYCHPQRVRT